jgi:TRAP-type C4-dicarboxylate transport system permease large subunit
LVATLLFKSKEDLLIPPVAVYNIYVIIADKGQISRIYKQGATPSILTPNFSFNNEFIQILIF